MRAEIAEKLFNEGKKTHYENIQKLSKEFEKENHSIICRELLGLSVKKG